MEANLHIFSNTTIRLVVAFALLSLYPWYPLGGTQRWSDVLAKIKISACAGIRTPHILAAVRVRSSAKNFPAFYAAGSFVTLLTPSCQSSPHPYTLFPKGPF
jgi:hypothetical protein